MADSLKAMFDELQRLETKGMEHARQSIDELARLSHAALAWGAQMSAEWRRMTLDVSRRAADLWPQKG